MPDDAFAERNSGENATWLQAGKMRACTLSFVLKHVAFAAVETEDGPSNLASFFSIIEPQSVLELAEIVETGSPIKRFRRCNRLLPSSCLHMAGRAGTTRNATADRGEANYGLDHTGKTAR